MIWREDEHRNNEYAKEERLEKHEENMRLRKRLRELELNKTEYPNHSCQELAGAPLKNLKT